MDDISAYGSHQVMDDPAPPGALPSGALKAWF
jgi:hypothetical protein